MGAERRRIRRAVTAGGVAYRIWVGGPVPPGADGITLRRLVVVRTRCAASPYLLRHEAHHVEQFARLGTVGFAARYAGAYLRLRLRGYPHPTAYRRIPLEIEADWTARRALRPRRVGTVRRVAR